MNPIQILQKTLDSIVSRSPWSPARRLARLLPFLGDSDSARREKALEELSDLTLLHGFKDFSIPSAVGLAMIQAAARSIPNSEWGIDVNADLLRMLWKDGRPEYLPMIESSYDALEGMEEARESALRLLTEMATPDSLALLILLLERPTSRTIETSTLFVPIKPSQALATSFLPRLLPVIPKLESRASFYDLVLDFANGGFFEPESHAQFVGYCVSEVDRLWQAEKVNFDAASRWLDGLDPSPDDSSPLSDRFMELEILADLLGHIRTPESRSLLNQLLESRSHRIRLFTAGSILVHGAEVDQAVLEELAKTPLSRALLWDVMKERHALDRFPWAYRSQEALAEAHMCQWLSFPTEMGCAPTEIETLAVVRLMTEGRNRIGYFFKFRREGPWEVGLAGWYEEGAPPTLNGNKTFSRFKKLDELDLDSHIREYVEPRTFYSIVDRQSPES